MVSSSQMKGLGLKKIVIYFSFFLHSSTHSSIHFLFKYIHSIPNTVGIDYSLTNDEGRRPNRDIAVKKPRSRYFLNSEFLAEPTLFVNTKEYHRVLQ